MSEATDRVTILTDQLSEPSALSFARLDGLTDEEYLWESVPGIWVHPPEGRSRDSLAPSSAWTAIPLPVPCRGEMMR